MSQKAYYSLLMDTTWGHAIWLNDKNEEVKITSAGIKPEWPDVIEVGEVTQHVRGGINPASANAIVLPTKKTTY
jgi:hypothetical protein